MSEIDYDDSPGAMDAPEGPAAAPESPAETPAENVPEASTEAPAETEKPSLTFSDEQQAFINGLMKEQKQRLREVERSSQERIEALEARQVAQPPDDGPVIPDMPTGWESDYEQLVQDRDQKIRERAAWEAQEEAKAAQQQQLAMQAQQAKQQQELEAVQAYTERAKPLGIDEGELRVAGNAVANFGIDLQVADFILREEQGPAITVYLSKNIQELQNLKAMNPMRAAIHIATQIKPRVSRSLKRQAPPEPTETVQGASSPEKERGPKGAVYE